MRRSFELGRGEFGKKRCRNCGVGIPAGNGAWRRRRRWAGRGGLSRLGWKQWPRILEEGKLWHRRWSTFRAWASAWNSRSCRCESGFWRCRRTQNRSGASVGLAEIGDRLCIGGFTRDARDNRRRGVWNRSKGIPSERGICGQQYLRRHGNRLLSRIRQRLKHLIRQTRKFGGAQDSGTDP